VFPWPGLPYEYEGRHGRLYLGPTLSALLHPGSRFKDLAALDGVFLLYPAKSAGGAPQRVQQLCREAYKARGAEVKLLDRLHLVPVEGVADPTAHESIMRGIEGWLGADPFNARKREGKRPTRIVVNLSPGTPAMHACWLMLRWSGELVPSKHWTVEFVQGDGGLGDGPPERAPLREVPVAVLSRYRPPEAPARPPAPQGEQDAVPLDELSGPPFDALCQKIDQAALLGLPVLLQGERGTGKTFLARYYHERRRGRRAPPPAALQPRPATKVAPGVWLPRQDEADAFVTVTLSEFATLDNLRDTLFGWAERAWNLAYEPYDGLLGAAHRGTLFLDEVHHLDRSLQAALLGPLNSRLYRPKMATYELYSAFDLVVATNDPAWRERLADDFRDRIERIVLEVPAFRSFQRTGAELLLHFWDYTIRRRCRECNIVYTQDGDWTECRTVLGNLFRLYPVPGNWRDLQRLADNLLLALTPGRDGNPPPVCWRRDQLEQAIGETFNQ
jgi:Sigma-54 interaction domain